MEQSSQLPTATHVRLAHGNATSQSAPVKFTVNTGSRAIRLPHVELNKAQSITVQMPNMLGLQTGGTKRPFFFLHGDYKGGAFYCYGLAQALGMDQPFYALEPCRLDDPAALPTVEEMAARHIQLLRRVQPLGPYLLGGFCNGALIAYEMARQLQEAGQKVDLLLLMDPVPVGHLHLLRRAIQYCAGVLGLDESGRVYSFLWIQHAFNYIQHIYRCLSSASYRILQHQLDDEQIREDGGTVLALKSLYELHLGQRNELQGITAAVKDITRKNVQGSGGFAAGRVKWGELFPDALFPSLAALLHDWGHVFYWQAAEYVPARYNGKSSFVFFHESKGYRQRARRLKLARTIDREVEVQTLPGTEGTWKTTHLHQLATYIRASIARRTHL